MNNSELFNQFEGKEVGKLVWPFFRYKALIPEQIGGDLFVWLYLSLVIFDNQGRNLPDNNYDDEVKQNVQKILNEKFSAVIDAQTMEKIINNAERDFVVKVTNKSGGKSLQLKDDTFSFINTYENLFSDKLDVKYIYQDAITGEVLPFFGDTSGLEDSRDDSEFIKPRPGVKEPSKKAVKKAYEQYIKIKKHNEADPIDEIEFVDEYFDEDEQTYLDDDVEEITFNEEKKELKSLRNYNVVFLKDQKSLFNLDVPLYVMDNEIVARSPFEKNTNQWMDKCLKKGRNISDDLDGKLKDVESVCIVEEKKIESFIEGHKKDFASSLKVFQTLYRMIDGLNDNRLRDYVIKLDSMFTQQNELFYFYCGKYLERLVKKINYNKSDANIRSNTDYETFCRELDSKLQYKNVEYNFVKSINIYNDWKKKYTRWVGREFASFKADVADILLRTDITNSQLLYPSFIDDLFNLYSLRSTVDHDDDNAINIAIEQDKVDKITKLTKVLFELI